MVAVASVPFCFARLYVPELMSDVGFPGRTVSIIDLSVGQKMDAHPGEVVLVEPGVVEWAVATWEDV